MASRTRSNVTFEQATNEPETSSSRTGYRGDWHPERVLSLRPRDRSTGSTEVRDRERDYTDSEDNDNASNSDDDANDASSKSPKLSSELSSGVPQHPPRRFTRTAFSGVTRPIKLPPITRPAPASTHPGSVSPESTGGRESPIMPRASYKGPSGREGSSNRDEDSDSSAISPMVSTRLGVSARMSNGPGQMIVDTPGKGVDTPGKGVKRRVETTFVGRKSPNLAVTILIPESSPPISNQLTSSPLASASTGLTPAFGSSRLDRVRPPPRKKHSRDRTQTEVRAYA
jgi:hypothetical protein